MNIYEFAKKLDGREYLNELTKDEEKDARKLGFVVVFGYSDDNTEFRGAIDGEVPSWKGATIVIDSHGIIENCNGTHGRITKENARIIETLWCEEESCPWTYRTEIPHATFNIYENKDIYCKGIVFDKKDLP